MRRFPYAKLLVQRKLPVTKLGITGLEYRKGRLLELLVFNVQLRPTLPG
jgi:hypothetical protein